MSQKSENRSPSPGNAPPARVYLTISGIGALILSVILGGFLLGDRLVSLDAPMVNGVTRIKMEAAITGLMVEEILSDGIVAGLEESWKPLDSAVAALRRMNEKQAGWKSALLPDQRFAFRKSIGEVEKKRVDWSASAKRRAREGDHPLVLTEA